HWRRGWALLPNITGLLMLGMIWLPFNLGASAFFIYAAAMAAWLGSARRAVIAVCVITAMLLLQALVLNAPVMFWAAPALVCLLVGLGNVFYAERERQAAVLRLTQQEVRQLAQVAERERISRDLHDLLGHTLSVITLKAELASRVIDND